MPEKVSDKSTMSEEGSENCNMSEEVSDNCTMSEEGNLRGKGRTTVFLTNLPEFEIKEKDIRKHLETCGIINLVISSNIKYGGRIIKRIAVVFSSEKEADKAALRMCILLEGRHVFISKLNQYTPSAKTVVISNLKQDVIEEDLWQSFIECGPICHIKLMWNTNQLIGAQIHFQDESGAKKALKQKDKLVKGNVVSLRCPTFEMTNMGHDPVVVTEVTKDTCRKDVEAEFCQYGAIKFVKFNHSHTFATIFYEDQKSADAAVKSGEAEFRFKSVPDLPGLVNPLLIAGVPKDGKDVDLFLKFQECGLIHDIRQVNNSRNFIIQFKEPESVKKALAMKDLSIHGTNVNISTPGSAPTPDKAFKRKAEQIVRDVFVKTDDNASDGAVSTSLSPEAKKKKKKKKTVTNVAVNAYSVAAM